MIDDDDDDDDDEDEDEDEDDDDDDDDNNINNNNNMMMMMMRMRMRMRRTTGLSGNPLTCTCGCHVWHKDLHQMLSTIDEPHVLKSLFYPLPLYHYYPPSWGFFELALCDQEAERVADFMFVRFWLPPPHRILQDCGIANHGNLIQMKV